MTPDEVKDKLNDYEVIRKREKNINRRIAEERKEHGSESKLISKLIAQKITAERKMMAIIEALETLGNSKGRNILELRYIDMRTWTEIESIENISHSSCFREREKAIRILSEDEKAVKLLNEI